MPVSMKALALTFALIWSSAVGCAALVHLAIPSYAVAFLALVSSIYPGFHGGQNFADALVGIAYALADGAFGGFIFAWLYNHLLPQAGPTAAEH